VTKIGPSDGQVKVRVPLLGMARKSGFESETLWAEPLGGNRYRIWNLPVFAYNLDMRAVWSVATIQMAACRSSRESWNRETAT
jgi:hypothetical protein